MATLPTLCEHLSRSDGRTAGSLRVVGNALRTAGHMDVGGIGRGAIHVTAQDAGALVLASLWTDSPCASHRAVEVLASLKRKPGPPVENLPQAVALIVTLPTFGEVVGALIEYGWLLRRQIGGLHLELTVTRPVPTAALALVDDFGRRRLVAEWQVDAAKLAAGFYLPEMRDGFDRRHATTITSETLIGLADLIRPAAERVDA